VLVRIDRTASSSSGSVATLRGFRASISGSVSSSALRANVARLACAPVTPLPVLMSPVYERGIHL
jgi:hypothetical protein